MSFVNLMINQEYKSFVNNVVKQFYIPVLSESIRYDRAVGYFSSTSLKEITRGIAGLIENGGKIRVITSPSLSADDIDAIKMGYEMKEKIVEKAINSVFDEDLSKFDKKRLSLLANLIANGILEIKIALIEDENSIGIFHDKIGLMEDKHGNKVAFNGSLNETGNAFFHNYESIEVFKSWEKSDLSRVESKEEAFNLLWNNQAINVLTLNFPEVAMEKLMKFQTNDIELDIDEKEEYEVTRQLYISNKKEGPIIPAQVELRDYQLEAINNWRSNNFRGIFDMATGTGKTITGLSAAAHLAKEKGYKLSIVIVCPYQHLVEQWVDDIKLFNLQPVVGYSTSKQKNWKRRLEDKIDSYNLGVSKNFCFITTNATYSTPFIQNLLQSIERDFLLIIDEAHNFGAENLSTKLLHNANYRLGLSATIERHNDEEGTSRLFSYFGKKCIEYTLEKAIDNHMLTPYKYFPVPVFLTEEELEKYSSLTKEISKYIRKDARGRVTISDSAKFLLLERARLIAGAQEKIRILEEKMSSYRKDSHLLVYCGATTIVDPNYREGEVEEIEQRQIDIVTKILGNKLGMKVSQFTSAENAVERESIKQAFETGEQLQALVAIRCLDEGVNIPSIKTAFILASSTNPKEYIQRRGRVLRKFPGKEYAEIYDFITLPFPFENSSGYTPEQITSLKGLAIRELIRLEDFASLAENYSYSFQLIQQIKEVYRINFEEEEFNV